MNKKHLISLFLTAVLIMTFTFNCLCTLGIENLEGELSYADTSNVGAEAITEPQREIRYEHGISEKNAKIINTLISYWNNYGLLTILIVLVIIVVIAGAVSVKEKKKLREIEKHIDKKDAD